MSTNTTHTGGRPHMGGPSGLRGLGIAVTACILAGCGAGTPSQPAAAPRAVGQRPYRLRYLDVEQCRAIPDPVGLEMVQAGPAQDTGLGTVVLRGRRDRVMKAQEVLDIADASLGTC